MRNIYFFNNNNSELIDTINTNCITCECMRCHSTLLYTNIKYDMKLSLFVKIILLYILNYIYYFVVNPRANGAKRR